ncbi:MAG TPA: HIRAN domain-containing protein [Thiobacillaceae bacterium]|nr:HIRAN domain-containing protein [Thiobacillaceae bacterium]
MRRTTRPAWLLLALALPAAAGVEGQTVIQSSPLAGFQYHAGRALFPLMAVGDRLGLMREPDNPHDAKAILVTWRGAVIGYLPRNDNLDLARLMDRGLRVEGRVLHLQSGRDPWKRVLIEVLAVDETDANATASSR